MSRRPPPNLDATALTAAFGSRVSPVETREGRIALCGEVFQALLAGRLPSREAALFVAGAGMRWLHEGGNLERDFLRVRKPKSHHTVAYVWARQQAELDPHWNDNSESPDDAQ